MKIKYEKNFIENKTFSNPGINPNFNIVNNNQKTLNLSTQYINIILIGSIFIFIHSLLICVSKIDEIASIFGARQKNFIF